MKPFLIAGIEIKNRYVSAPLAGYSDYARRRINYDYGAGLLYTERGPAKPSGIIPESAKKNSTSQEKTKQKNKVRDLPRRFSVAMPTTY